MIRRILLGIVMFVSFAAVPAPVMAQEGVLDPICVTAPDSVVCHESKRDPEGTAILGPNSIFVKVARIIALVVGVAAVVMLVVGGLQFILSTGDASKITSARNTIIYALVGLVVAILAGAIIQFVLINV